MSYAIQNPREKLKSVSCFGKSLSLETTILSLDFPKNLVKNMKSLILKFIEAIVKPFYAKKSFQSFFGVLFNISLRGMNFRNSNHLNNGESYVVDCISDYFKNKNSNHTVIMDIGANVGNCTQMICEKFQAINLNFTVYSFEPLPATYEELKARFQNVKNVVPLNLGVGKKNERVNMYSNHETSELASLYKTDLDYVGIDTDMQIQTEIVRLDDFILENHIGKINFMKIDVEGSEFDILSSSPSAISKTDFIQFEFGTSNVVSRTYLKDFFELLNPDFKMYRILKDGLLYFEKYHPDNEIAILCNYLAVSRKIEDFNA